MIIRLLKGYTLDTGKRMPVGKVFRRKNSEAQIMIENKIAEPYQGSFPPVKMKTNFFKPKE